MNRYQAWLDNQSLVRSFFENNQDILPRNMKSMISGCPFYVEAIKGGGEIRGEIGGFLSDHGSVSGFKIGTDHSIGNEHFNRVHPLHIAFYSAFWFGKKTDRFIINLISQKRKIHFYPWGWEETSILPNRVHLRARVHTHLARDHFVMSLTLTNPADTPVTMSLPFALSLSHTEDHEGMADFREPSRTHHLVTCRPHYFIYKYRSGKSQIGHEVFYRSLYCTTPFTLTPKTKYFKSPRTLIGTLNDFTIPAGGTFDISFHVLTKRTSKELAGVLDAVSTYFPEVILKEDADIFKKTLALWHKRFNTAPPLPFKSPVYVHLYGLALTHAMMNLRPPYAVGEGPAHWSSSPARGHFDQHWGWDTPYQAWTYSMVDPSVAFDHLQLQWTIMQKFGYLPYWTPVDLKHKRWVTRLGLKILGISMPPVQGEVVRNLAYTSFPSQYDNSGKKKVAEKKWVHDTHDLLLGQIRFWSSRAQGIGIDQLMWWKSSLESGWDDTPALTFARGHQEVVPFHRMAFSRLVFRNYMFFRPKTFHVDASVFYWDLLLSLRWLRLKFEYLQKKPILYDLDSAIISLRGKINAAFWSGEDGTYYNVNRGRHVKIKTPIMLWPVAFGTPDNYSHVQSVIEKHLLNPDVFWGPHGVPTVAFNEEKYFNKKHRGYYWRGALWPLVNYYAACALSAHGFTKEANELVDRLCHLMISADPGGLHENYDSLVKRVGYGCGTGRGGIGEPSAFGQGFTNLTTFLILLRFYDHRKFVYDDPRCRNNRRIEGFVHHVYQNDVMRTRLITIDSDKFPNLPHTIIQSADPKLGISQTPSFEITIQNHYDISINGLIRLQRNIQPYALAPGEIQTLTVHR